MIPRLYAAGTTVFTSEGLGALSDCISCISSTSINGVPELNIVYPTNGRHAADIGDRCVIVADRDQRMKAQPYIVKTIDRSTPNRMEIYAIHLCVELVDGVAVRDFTATSLSDTLTKLQTYKSHNLAVTFSTDFSSSKPFEHAYPSTMKKAMGGMEGSIIDTYGGEWDFNGLTATLTKKIGQDNGVVIRYGKNLASLKMEVDWSVIYTGIYPYWVNKDTGAIRQMSTPVYELGTFTFVRVLMLDASSDFQTSPTDPELLQYAVNYAASHDLLNPLVSWNVVMQDLRMSPEYKSLALLEEVSLGDTVTIYFPEFGVNGTARIVSEKYNVLSGRYTDLNIGGVKASLASTIVTQAAEVQAEIEDTTTSLYDAIQRATQLITGNIGGCIVMKLNASGEPEEMLIMDTTDTSTATKVWRWNLSGLGYSSTGINGPYTTAITQNGQIVADFITTGTLAANMVTACNLTAGTIKSTDGTTFVLDLSTGSMSIDGTGGGINLKNCGINIQSSQTFTASSYSASDTTRIQQIMLGNITPTSADYAKYDFYGSGVIGTASLLACNAMVNTGSNLLVTWYAQMDTSKSQIIKVWRTTSGAINSNVTVFNVTAGGVIMEMAQPIAISGGGTGANTAAQAIINLGATAKFYEETTVNANTAYSVTITRGQVAYIGYVTSSTTAANITMKLNGLDPVNSSYTYAGNTNNFGGQNILARSGSSTYGSFAGTIMPHGIVTEVNGTGRRGDGANVMGVTNMAFAIQTVTSITFSAAGTLTILVLG